MTTDPFDAIVIGAGAGGLTAAIGLTKVGKRVALIEKGLMGGDCTNVGCIPSKTLIHHAREAAIARKLGTLTDLEGASRKALRAVRAKVKEIRSHEEAPILEKMGITVYEGLGSFVDTHTIKVERPGKRSIKLRAKHIILATGSKPRSIPIEGLAPRLLLTNETIFNLKVAPKKLLVVGGGPIGCELAQAFHHLGTKVTIVSRSSTLLAKEEPSIQKATQARFEEQGIEVLCSSKVFKVSGNQATIACKDGVSKKRSFDYVLLAVGRVPHTEGLNLESINIHTNRGRIPVNHHYKTIHKHIFAIGDVSAKYQFTHLADDMGRHVVKKILLPWSLKKEKPLPKVTYLDEEVASVGLSCSEARAIYGEHDIHVIRVPLSATDRAKTDELTGEVIVTVRKLTGTIVGASIMARAAGELINTFTVAIQNKISIWKLGQSMYPYPVLGRAIKKAADQMLSYTASHWKEDLKYKFLKHLTKIIAGSFWLSILISFVWYQQANNLGSLDIAIDILEFLTGSPYGPALYILVYALRPVLLFPATLLTLISGALFGFWGGALYTILGENLSASVAYGLGRVLGKDMFPTEGIGLISQWKKRLHDNAFITLLILRFSFLPFDLINYMSGILHVRYWQYVTATAIGIMPGLLAFVSFGASVENFSTLDLSQFKISAEMLLLGASFLTIGILLTLYFRKRDRSKRLMGPDTAVV